MRSTWRIGTAVLALLLAWLFLSGPGGAPLTSACQPVGIVNQARSVLQGERFWHSVGVIMEREQRGSATPTSLGACRQLIYARAGMTLSEKLR